MNNIIEFKIDKKVNPKFEETKDVVFFERSYQNKFAEAKKYILRKVVDGELVEDSDMIFEVTHNYKTFHTTMPLIDSLESAYSKMQLELIHMEEEMHYDKNLIFSNYKTLKMQAEYVRRLAVWFDEEVKKFFSYFMYIHREEIFESNLPLNDYTICNIKAMMYNDLNMYISQKRA